MASAVIVAEYLWLRECPAIAFPIPPSFELGPTAGVGVPSEFLHRARWFWRLADVEDLTDAELEYLATGKLPGSALEPEPVSHDAPA
jgi:hypothetical protein